MAKTNTQNMEKKMIPKQDQEIIMDISEMAKEVSKTPVRVVTGNVLVDNYRRLNDYFLDFGRIKVNDKVQFFSLLAVLVNAGVPLVKSLFTLANQLESPKFKKIINSVAKKVERGQSLSEAMMNFPKVFEDAQVGMVAAAEASGQMNTVLQEIGNQLEKRAAINSKIKGAMIYPIAIFTLLIAVIAVMLIVVIPKMTDVFTSSGKEIPTETQILLALSNFAIGSWYKILIFGGLVGFFIHLWGKTPNGRYNLDNFKLHLPIFGLLIRKVCLARFARALSGLIASGVPIIKCMQITAELVSNAVYREKLLSATEDISRGIPMGEALSSDPFLFPDIVVNMITIGEQTAEVDAVTKKIADFYETSVDTTVNGLSKLLEPIVMVAIGGIVGGLVYSIMGPIMSMGDIQM